MSEFLYGRNAARECLRARRRHIHRVLIAQTIQKTALVKEVVTLAQNIKIPIQSVAKRELDRVAKGHQGIVLEVGRYPTVDVTEILKRAKKLESPAFILTLDHIEDPHNLGAMLRTAEAVGVHGVIIPRQRAVGVTPAVVKASAGAAEHVWIADVSNLAQTLKKVKQAGPWVVGLENKPEATPFYQANLADPIIVVVGSEGKGMSRLVRETCDFLVKLPMQGHIESLNASVAAALILYEVWRARSFPESKPALPR